MSEHGYRVGVLGATGAVGSTILEVLAERGFPVDELVAVRLRALGRAASSSSRAGGSSAGALSDETIQGLDLVLSSAGGAVSAEWAPRLVAAGAVVVDNTSYWRMHPDVPLVVAEVNPDAADGHSGLVANPNCSTMQLVVALAPIERAVGIERIVDLHLPVGLGHRPAGRRRAPRPGPRACSTSRTSRADGLPAPDRLQRPPAGRDASRTATTTRPRSAS